MLNTCSLDDRERFSLCSSPILTAPLETVPVGTDSGRTGAPSPSRAKPRSHPRKTRLSGHNAPVLLSSTLWQTKLRDPRDV